MSKKEYTLSDGKRIFADDSVIDVSDMNFFDELEYDSWDLFLKYCDAIGIEVSDREEPDWYTAKEIQDKVLDVILDCVKQRQSDYILALPKDRNALYSGILKVTKIKGFSCKTLYHGYEYGADAIIQTYRKDDPLCLAACSGCIKAINNGLRKVNPRNTYFYDSKKDLEIRYISNNDSHKCHSCGNKYKHCYYVRLCNVVFYLCEKCKTSWIGQLERVPFDIQNN